MIPTTPLPLEQINTERFWQKVRKTKGCWLWTAATNRKGYGMFWIKAKGNNYLAHRISYRLHYGPIPEGMLVLHKCDTPRCVNPDHLFLGTAQDNLDDAVRKGRYRMRTIPDDVVVNIYRLSHGGALTSTELAKRFGVDPSTVRYIAQGKLRKRTLREAGLIH